MMDYIDVAQKWVREILAENDIVVIEENLSGYYVEETREAIIRYRLSNAKKKDSLLCYRLVRRIDSENVVTFAFSANDLMIYSTGQDNGVDKIIDKIRKLLALSDESSNPSQQEAILAASMAQKLMKKYDLSLDDIAIPMSEKDIIGLDLKVPSGQKWKYQLAVVVAKSYRCRLSCASATGTIFSFWGYASDAVIARRMFNYLFIVGNKLAMNYANRFRAQYGTARGVYNSFVRGYLVGVKSELERGTKALALIVPDEVNTFFEQKMAGSKTKKAKSPTVVYKTVYDAGRREGCRAMNATYLEG